MDTTRRQDRACFWVGVAVFLSIAVVLIALGSLRASSINQASHRKWHATTARITSTDPAHGVTLPEYADADIVYPAPGKQGELTKRLRLYPEWKTGDTLKMWVTDSDRTYIPADVHTGDADPFPLVAGTVIGFIILGIIAGIVLGILFGYFTYLIFVVHNSGISNQPLKPDLLW